MRKPIHVLYDLKTGIIFQGSTYLNASIFEGYEPEELKNIGSATIENPEKNFFNKHISEFTLFIPGE